VMFLLLFGGVNVAVIRLRKLRPDLDRGFRVPFMPFTPIAAIGAMLFIAVYMFFQYPMAWVAAGGWIVAGVGFYYGYSRKRETAFAERVRWMERIDREEYSVLVAVSNPHTVDSLMEAGLAIARQHSGKLIVVTVAEVPEGLSLMSGRKPKRSQEELIDRALRYASSRGLEARGLVKIAHLVSAGILETALEEECNFLVLGAPGAQSLLERFFASIVERVLQGLPNQVGIVYGALDPVRVRGVVVPITKGASSELAAELGPGFGKSFGAPVRVVTVVPNALAPKEAATVEREALETMRKAEHDGALQVVRGTNAESGLLDSLSEGDLVVIGAPTTDPVAALLAETLPQTLARLRTGPMIVVRDVEAHRTGRFERFFLGTR